MKTTTFATAGVTGAVLVLLVLLAVPAGAALYPSGCDEWADSQPSNSSWSDNCWLSTSPSHDSAGNYVTGVQRLLAAEGRYGGAVDGLFGSGIRNGVISYQSSRGLSADGVVGTSTWYSMWNDVAANAYMGVCDGSYHCYGPAFGNRSYQAFKRYSGWMFGQDAPWFTRRTGGTGAAWVTFDVGGPA